MLLRGLMRADVGMLRRMNTAETATCRRSGRSGVTSSTRRWATAATLAALLGVCSPTAHAEPGARPGTPAPEQVTGPWVAIAGIYGSRRIAHFTAAAEPGPGVSIVQRAGNDESVMCTTGWPVMSTRRDVGYLTAGHCDYGDGAPLWMFTDDTGSGVLPLPPLQNAERGSDENGHTYDTALFFLSPQQQSSGFGTSVAAGVHLRGVISVRQATALAPGTAICMNGSRSGITCGPLIQASDDGLEWGGAAVKGDSGAPVFVVNAAGDALAIGTLSGGPTVTDNHATYLEPVLTRLKLRVIIASSAAGDQP